ncbi:MAG: hypothetical protein Fur0032_17100 [Terrimicrobiaceae bacterium]
MRVGLQTWGSEGDCRPFLHLAAGLARAGHEVRLVVTEVAARSYADDAARGGFDLREVASPVFRDIEVMRRLESDLLKAASPPQQARLLLERAFDPVCEPVEEASRELAAWAEVLVGHYFFPRSRRRRRRQGSPTSPCNSRRASSPAATRAHWGDAALARWAIGCFGGFLQA